MRSLAPVVASVVVALLMLFGFLHFDALNLALSASEGAALALAILAAFLITYDLGARDNRLGSGPPPTRAAGVNVSPVVDVNALFVLEAAGRARASDPYKHINGKTSGLSKDTPVALSIVVRPGSDFDRDGLQAQVTTVAANFRDYRYVHFFTAPRKHLCFASADDLIALLKKPDDGRAFVDLINNGRDDELVRSYAKDGLKTTSLECTLDQREGLRRLAEQKEGAAMVIFPPNQKPLGVIDWPTLALRVVAAPPAGSRERREPR